MTTFAFTPVDAWFFRDGRSYNESESNQANVASIFPPFASTIAGAVRAALARSRGWNGRNRWTEELNSVLGDGPENLGTLSFRGPFLLLGEEPLWPVPRHLLLDPNARPAALLRPRVTATECDLENVRLPAKTDESATAKVSEHAWITRAGLDSILRGERPATDTIVRADKLWGSEPRVGLLRDERTRTTKEGALYSPAYIRLTGDVRLAMNVDGIPSDWQMPELLALGGESRLAYCEAVNGIKLLPDQPEFSPATNAAVELTLTLLTPAFFGAHDGVVIPPRAGDDFPGLPGVRVVSACVGRAVYIGGWDSLERRPLPLTPFFPAGSTWFLEVQRDHVASVTAHHGKCIGEKTKFGFGQIALGVWPRTAANPQSATRNPQ